MLRRQTPISLETSENHPYKSPTFWYDTDKYFTSLIHHLERFNHLYFST